MSLEVRQFSAVAPQIMVKDVDVSLAFYEEVLQFTVLAKSSDETGLTAYAEAVFSAGRVVQHQPQGAFMVMFARVSSAPTTDKTWLRQADAGPRGRGLAHYVYVDDVDAFHEAVVGGGGKVSVALAATDWGDRTFSIDDPDGYRWTFATNVHPYAE